MFFSPKGERRSRLGERRAGRRNSAGLRPSSRFIQQKSATLSKKSVGRSPGFDHDDATNSPGNAAPTKPLSFHKSNNGRDAMKRGVFVFAVTMTVAGVASALGFAPVAQAPRPAQVASRPPSEPIVSLAAAPKSTLEARQAPVPLVLKTRTSVALPDFDSAAPASAPAAEAKANEGDGGAAKAAVEADGYKNVKVLRKGANGLWYAEALRGKTKVLLTVDSQGNVAAE
jgi:hypothetical protein